MYSDVCLRHHCTSSVFERRDAHTTEEPDNLYKMKQHTSGSLTNPRHHPGLTEISLPALLLKDFALQ
jgi:hypothetical protein